MLIIDSARPKTNRQILCKILELSETLYNRKNTMSEIQEMNTARISLCWVMGFSGWTALLHHCIETGVIEQREADVDKIEYHVLK